MTIGDGNGNFQPFKPWRETVQRIYEREEARRDGAERQATTLLGVVGVVASFVTGVGNMLLENAQRNNLPFTLFLGMTFCLALMSLVVSVLFAVRALRRIPIHVLLPEEAQIQEADTDDTYNARISMLLAEITTKNYAKTDLKVDAVRFAQRAFVTGVLFLALAGVGTAVFSLNIVFSAQHQANSPKSGTQSVDRNLQPSHSSQ